MKRFTEWLVSRLIEDHRNARDLEVRARYGAVEGWLSIILNSILFAFKFAVGLWVGSIALIADAVHTMSDSVTSVVLIIGFKMAKRPSDREHPFGHGRMEAITTLVVAVLLFIAGAELLYKSAVSAIWPTSSSAPYWIIAVVSASA
ncbi:MAG: cation diffusion facilitator family transporter, partial [Planctomycetes bacterium]|nr:cation diffusion facilitator family transporter [Planctomycetota bacterium]